MRRHRSESLARRIRVALPVTFLVASCAVPSGPFLPPRGPISTAREGAGRSGPVDLPSPSRSSPAESAAAALESLPTKGRSPKAGFDRRKFGPAWTDDVGVEGGHNGCDTRNDILRRDLRPLTIRPGSRGCTVAEGRLEDPYGGRVVAFRRGPRSSEVQIDHVVALANAWQTGARELDAEHRRDLANDPMNLISTEGRINAAKRDGDAATWLPPRRLFRCRYVARQVAVKKRYRLWVTRAEREAIRRVLRTCPGEPLPRGADVATPRPVPGRRAYP